MVTDILYQIGVVIAVILIGYRLYKETSLKKDLMKIIGVVILTLWFFHFLEFQFPTIQEQDMIKADQYYNTTLPKRDMLQEDYHLYQVSDAIARFIPSTIKEPVLIVFPEELMAQLPWDWASYWQRRLTYRNYQIPMDFIIQDRKGQFHDFYQNLLLSNAGKTKDIQKLPIIPQDILKKYFFTLYIHPEPANLPDGFKEWRKTDYVLILKKDNTR